MEKEPECFGQEWSSSASECTGGYDPGYVGPTGGHVRPRCDYFESCKTRSLLKKQTALIPTASLIRPPSYTPQPYAPQPITSQPYAAPYVPGRTALQPAPPQTHWNGHPSIHMDPVRMVPMAHEMPAYLTVHEERHPGESYWAPLLRVIFRSVGKAIGHALSNFFDRTPLRMAPPPQR